MALLFTRTSGHVTARTQQFTRASLGMPGPGMQAEESSSRNKRQSLGQLLFGYHHRNALRQAMGSPTDAATHVVPTHQRITSSKQWVIDRKEPARQINIRPKSHSPTAASTSTAHSAAAERESRKKLKELETAKLQVEYDSVKQENDKLKKVILRLKQEIDVYAGLIGNEQQQRDSQRVPDPQVKDLLINTSKRRKRSGIDTVPQPRAAKAPDPNEPVSKDDIVLMNTLSDVLAQME